jgi:hypothetical protein
MIMETFPVGIDVVPALRTDPRERHYRGPALCRTQLLSGLAVQVPACRLDVIQRTDARQCWTAPGFEPAPGSRPATTFAVFQQAGRKRVLIPCCRPYADCFRLLCCQASIWSATVSIMPLFSLVKKDKHERYGDVRTGGSFGCLLNISPRRSQKTAGMREVEHQQ